VKFSAFTAMTLHQLRNLFLFSSYFCSQVNLVNDCRFTGTNVPIVLQQGKMKLWTLEQCQSAYSYATSIMQCAGYSSGYIANCPVRLPFSSDTTKDLRMIAFYVSKETAILSVC
jgi:hypothetical protein